MEAVTVESNKDRNPNTTIQLKTRWTDEIDPENVLPAYPRPQMVRQKWRNLNGLWNYAIRPIDELVKNFDGKILVPFPLESYLSSVQKPLQPNELLWYQTTFTIDEDHQNEKVLLHFGAVDWKMTLWINDKKVGEHIGGYNPFYFDITNVVVIGENDIRISVWDPTDSENEQRGKQTLNPGGIFYTAISGIWQTVWLEFVPQQHITSIKLTPNIDEQSVTISVETNVDNNGLAYEVEVFEKDKLIASENSFITNQLTIPIPNPKLWSPDAPFLYDVNIKLLADEMVDSVSSYFGMRKFSIERDNAGKKRLFVNNKGLFQHGILDQGYWPDGLYTAPTDAALEYDVVTAKKLGFNMIRKHIKVEPARWYYHCDRHGMIVWQDMINGGSGWKNYYHFILPNFLRRVQVDDTKEKVQKDLGRNDVENRRRYKKELQEMIDALYNFTSIAMWIPFNEGWGQFNAKEIYESVREYDPTRYIIHASGWYDQQVGDIRSTHIYFRKLNMPNNILDRSVVISEYGGYKLRLQQLHFKAKKQIGYKEFKSKDSLLDAYKKLINDQLKPLIQQGLSASVYTQLTDVEEEVNGFISYDREQIKLDEHTLQSIHQSLINSAKGNDNGGAIAYEAGKDD